MASTCSGLEQTLNDVELSMKVKLRIALQLYIYHVYKFTLKQKNMPIENRTIMISMCGCPFQQKLLVLTAT